MRLKPCLLIALFSLVFHNLYSQDNLNKGLLTVQVSGTENREGKILLALCRNETEFTSGDSAFRAVHLSISEHITTHRFEDIPFGTYAIKVFHDADDDGVLDKSFLGMPTENYGFSNNARGTFGPASWADARFTFDQLSDTLIIHLE
ncbi:MAG: DUF2141 domain-containing protein [Calditrichales bacterium]|nr:MAG: DUF2141 domain-containing protein [Calditrichales bacterium]